MKKIDDEPWDDCDWRFVDDELEPEPAGPDLIGFLICLLGIAAAAVFLLIVINLKGNQ